MLRTALALLQAFESSTLGPLEREVLAITLGQENGCAFCVSLHRHQLRRLNAPEGIVSALEERRELPDPRLEVLKRFTLNAVARRGDVDEVVFREFVAQGFTHEQALEVVLGIAAYTLTTHANRLTETSEV